MYRPRIIPVLLLQNNALYKSVNFKNHKYIGDAMNAVRIYNNLKADELIFLDITASKENRCINESLVKNIGDESNMPFAVGGGIHTLDQIRKIINAGAEKIIINKAALQNPNFIAEAANEFGSSTVSVCIDVKTNFFGKKVIRNNDGSNNKQYSPVAFAQKMQQCGAGEIIVQSADNDGKMTGYDITLLQELSSSVTIPVVVLGGAGSLANLKEAHQKATVNGLAAGSMFVYHGKKRGVLINYPEKYEINSIFK